MKEDWERDPRPPRMRRDDDSRFSPSFWWTVLTVGGTALLSVAGAAYEPIFYIWFIAVLFALAGIIVAIVQAVYGRGSAAAGTVAGVAMSALILTVTCFANVQIIST